MAPGVVLAHCYTCISTDATVALKLTRKSSVTRGMVAPSIKIIFQYIPVHVDLAIVETNMTTPSCKNTMLDVASLYRIAAGDCLLHWHDYHLAEDGVRISPQST